MRFTLERIEECMAHNIGLCHDCGAERECTEPDAENYDCPECRHMSVFGAEQTLIMGLVD